LDQLDRNGGGQRARNPLGSSNHRRCRAGHVDPRRLLAGSSDGQAALVTALRAKHIALAKGVEAAATNGKPISAKYEFEGGKLQLSVYTEKGGQFSEIVVNHADGKVAKTEKITDAADLTAARTQAAAMAQATSSLAAAIEKALAANKGYGAVRATAALKDGKPVAQITLNKGTEFKTIAEPLS
jgi:hypothetical protein